jgi:hypothetical protein
MHHDQRTEAIKHWQAVSSIVFVPVYIIAVLINRFALCVLFLDEEQITELKRNQMR